jgi:hypothetical protein
MAGDEKDEKFTYRNGVEVAKLTIEFDKDLYMKIKVETARRDTTVRSFLTAAIIEKMFGSLTDPRLVEYNKTAVKVCGLLSTELPNDWPQYVIAKACEEAGIPIYDLNDKDIRRPAIRKKILRCVGHYSGDYAADQMSEEFDRLFGKVEDKR